jgi:hypothetical protein
MDWAAIALAAKRANAAYIEDAAQSRAAFSALGDDWIDIHADDSHQAVLSVDAAGQTHLSISGTRASTGKLLDIYADVSLEPTAVKGGTVTQGVVEGMQHLWDWVLQTVPEANPISVSGHSLGGARTHLTPLFLPAQRIGALHSFAAPKFVNADFYQTWHAELANMVCVLNGEDGWASWPWFDPDWQHRPPLQHIWLRNGGFQMVLGDLWPDGWRFSDHDMDRYQALVEGIATAAASQRAPESAPQAQP